MGDYNICIDQGFPWNGDAYRMLVGSVSKRAVRCLYCDVCDYLLVCINNVHMLLWQASEWGRGCTGEFSSKKAKKLFWFRKKEPTEMSQRTTRATPKLPISAFNDSGQY